MKQIGFVGLGIMGLPMSSNLARKSGLPVVGFDVVPERREMLVRNGGAATDDVDPLFADSDAVFLCLPTTELMREAVERIMEIGRPGTVIVDLGSSFPGTVRELFSLVKARGMHMVDSPVSGGEVGAVAGSLAIMSGGDREAFDRVLPLLLCMGARATYMGPTGNGSVAKLANNMIVAAHICAISEGFAYAVKAGLEPKTLFEAIKDGLAASAVMNLKIPKILSRDFTPSARSAVLQKDLRYAARLAQDMGVEIPLTQMVLDGYDDLEEMGRINEDHCNIVRLYERDMGVEVK